MSSKHDHNDHDHDHHHHRSCCDHDDDQGHDEHGENHSYGNVDHDHDHSHKVSCSGDNNSKKLKTCCDKLGDCCSSGSTSADEVRKTVKDESCTYECCDDKNAVIDVKEKKECTSGCCDSSIGSSGSCAAAKKKITIEEEPCTSGCCGGPTKTCDDEEEKCTAGCCDADPAVSAAKKPSAEPSKASASATVAAFTPKVAPTVVSAATTAATVVTPPSPSTTSTLNSAASTSRASAPALTSLSTPEVVLVKPDIICSACDPSSPVPHTLQVTRLRVANMCCAGEEKILRAALECLTGVDHISVNVIGRYAVIKHCTTPCCTPVASLVDILNAKNLGVSVSDVAGSGSDDEDHLDRGHQVLLSVIWLLFVVGCAVSHTHPLSSDILFLVSIGLGLLPVLSAACVALFRRYTIDISVLMTIAIAGAVAAEEYFDGSLVVALFLSAELLEAFIMIRVRAAIRNSSTQMAKDAYLASGAKVAVADLKIGDVIAVRAGEMILGDGNVVKGEGVVDESALTGESVPVTKKVGSVVMSGTVVQNGYIEVKLTSNTADNTVNRLKQTIEDVQADKGSYARLADRFAVYWTPGVLFTVLCLILIGGGVSEDWYVFVNRGLILLVLACPCAILIAAPVSSVCAIAAAAKQGVLLKGSSVLERMACINTVGLDKTGTLTKGFFKVAERCECRPDPDDDDVLDFDPMKLAAAIEAKSTHPLANAVVSEFAGCIAEMDLVSLPAVRKIQVVDGVGVSGWVEVDRDWKFVFVGNEKLLKEYGGKVRLTPPQKERVSGFQARSQGKVTLYVSIEDELYLMLSLADEVRPESSVFVRELQQQMGMTVAMITGDHRDVALKVCDAVGISESECHARLLPADKLSWVQQKQESGMDKVLMVGDGINDSTGLAAASIGVAMGAGGSAMAVTSADVVLMSDNLLLLPPTIRLCRQTDRTMKEGFVFAIAVKGMAIVLTILGLLTFWQAVVIDIGTLIVVVVNGTKPLWFSKFETKEVVLKGKEYTPVGVEMV